jgi:surface antigen
MKRVRIIAIVLVAGCAAFFLLREADVFPPKAPPKTGDRLDSLNNVIVYCNGGFSNTCGRNVVDGYNIGLKYQCVEFVKRYYFERFHHRMPNSYGNAKDFFDTSLADGTLNKARALLQFTNNSATRPQVHDLVVFDGNGGNPFGHVAIVSNVEDGKVEVVQQNTRSTRDRFDLDLIDGRWRIGSRRVLGWLRMP